MSGLVSVSYFLVSMVFSLVIFVLWLRIGFRYFRISQLHPIRQMIHRLTDPVFTPLMRVLQIRLTPYQRYDWVCFTVLVGVEWIKFLLLSLLYFGHPSLWTHTAAYTIADLILQPCDLLFYALLIRVVMSWLNPQWHHPLGTMLYGVTEPLLQRIRQRIPAFAGFDFSPFILMILLKIITVFVGVSLPFHL